MKIHEHLTYSLFFSDVGPSCDQIKAYTLERKLSRIYTHAVFKNCQEAYVAGTSFCTRKDGTFNFLVYYGKEGPTFTWSQHEFKVVCD